MAQTLKLKRTSVANKVPTTSNIEVGELAFNTNDKALFIRGDNNAIVTLHDESTLHIDRATNRVGIGTTSPNQFLDVSNTSGNANIVITASDTGTSSYTFGDSGGSFRGGMKYQHTDDQLFLRTNGSDKFTITSTGNVGIGTTSPSGLLSLENGTRTLDVKLETTPASGDVGVQFRAGASDFLGFAAGGGSGTGIVIDDSNRVGIGTSTLYNPLTVSGADSIAIDDYIIHNGDSNAKFGFSADDTIVFRTGGNERVRFTPSGTVGIGETVPDGELHVKGIGGGNGDIYLERTSGGVVHLQAQSAAGIIGTSSNHPLKLKSNNGVRIDIATSGAITFNSAYTFPTSDGSANQVLTTDGLGSLTFADVSGSSGVTVSNNANNRVLTGDGTNANAEANLTFDGSTLDVTGSITSSSTATASGGFITTSDLALRDYTTDARIHLGNSNGGASGVFAGRRLTDNTGLLYGTYWAYDAFWDDGNENWTANRSTLGRKWKAEMGYHLDSFKVSRFDGTVSSPWSQSDWDDLLTISSATSTFATDVNLTSGHVYKINGTTVIDSSRNLTNIGTISSGAITSSGNITVSGTVDGRDIAADGTKLDGIESGATADQTQSEINALGITATGLSGTPNITVGTIDATEFTGHIEAGANLDINVGTNYGTTTTADRLWISSFNTGQSDVPSSYVDVINLSTSSTHGVQIASQYGSTAGVFYMRNRSDNVNSPAGVGLQAWKRLYHQDYHPEADTLTTARTIGGVSFDGSANINLPGVNTAGNQNTSGTAAGLSGTPNITVGTISSGAITSTGAIQGTSFSDGTISGITFIDEDSFATNSATRVPTQQSIKAYVDAQVAGVVDSAPSALNTLNELAAALGDDANFSTTTSTALGNRLRVDTASQGLTGTQQANAITNLGITATKAELNYVDGVTSNIQTQLDGKQASGSYLTLSGTQTVTGVKTFNDIRADIFKGSSAPSNSFLDFDDDNSSNGINGVTLASVATMDFIIDTNNNGSTDVFVWGKDATNPSGANYSELMRLDGSGNLTLSGTVDGVDIAARDSVLTSTTTTANAALPKAGGTMTGNINLNGNNLNSVNLIGFQNEELSTFTGARQMLVDANDSDSNVPSHGDYAGSYPFGIYFTGDNDASTTTLGSGLVKVWHTGHFKKAHIDYFVGLYDSGVTTTEYDYLDGVTSNIQTQLNGKLSTSGTASQANNLNATDDRDIAPEDLSYTDDFRIYFADKGGLETGTIGSNYQDVLVLNSYSDATGGDANALAFDKSEKKIYHYQADQAATNWGTPKTLAYTDSNISGTSAGLSGTPNITVGTITSGAITSSGDIASRKSAYPGGRLVLDRTASAAGAMTSAEILFRAYGNNTTLRTFGKIEGRNTGYTDGQIMFYTENSGTLTEALTIDSSQNSTFAGTISSSTITTTGDIDLTGVSDTADEKIILPRGGHIAFYGDGSLSHAISSMGTDDIRINSYGEVILNLDSNNNQTNAANFRIVKHGGTSSAGTAVFSVDGENGNVTVTGTVDGRDIATDGTKLDTIDTNADVTPSWVPSSDPNYLTSVPNHSAALITSGTLNTARLPNPIQLSGANAIIKLQETDVTNSPNWWHVADGGNYSIRLNNTGTYPISINTNATNNAVSTIVMGYNTDFSNGIDVTGNITVTGNVDGRDVATDGTKLDGISSGADVTPSWVPSSDPGYLTSSSTQSKYLRSDTTDTASGVITFSDRVQLHEIRSNTGQEVIINVGESHTVAASQTGEFLYVNAESGIQVNASPDNWSSGWAGRKTFSYDAINGLVTSGGFSVDTSGNLSATTKSFDIPHPSKDGMRLRHGVLEGPENGVYVRGKSKEKVISLPDYWVDLIHEDSITVQLTAIGGGQELYVEKIEDNKVYVNGENYFYYIQAERKDVERFEVEYEV